MKCEVCGQKRVTNDTLSVSGYTGEYEEKGGEIDLFCVNPNCPLFCLSESEDEDNDRSGN